MKPRKPDRFERVANKFFQAEGPFSAVEIADLLRKEHRWVEQLVKKVYGWQVEQLADDEDVCSVILEHLKKRRK